MRGLKIMFGQQIYLKWDRYNFGCKYLLCVIDVFTKYAYVN